MMGIKQKLMSSEEYDILYEKHDLCYAEKAGVSHTIKKMLSKRRRRKNRQELKRILKNELEK